MARTDYGAILSTKIADTSQAIRDVNKTVGTIAPADWGTLIRAMKSGADYQNALDQMVEESATGSIASFTDGANNIPTKEVICHINPTETGTGEKSPQNPYVIGGFTEANITRAGANVWDEEWVVGIIDNQGRYSPSGSRVCSKNYIKVFPNTTYYRNSNIGWLFFYESELASTFISSLSTANTTFTTPANARYMKFYTAQSYGSTYNNDVSINQPSTVTDYEPYITPTVYNVPFGQTVYGGTLNVTTGVLTREFNYFRVTMVTGISDARLARVNLLSFGQPLSAGYSLITNPFICNIFKSSNYSTSYNNHIHFINAQSFAILPAEEIGTEIADWNNFLANNPCYICYKRQTPLTVQLTPTEIKTLLGANNIYHDCNGDTDVIYRANGALYVEQHS